MNPEATKSLEELRQEQASKWVQLQKQREARLAWVQREVLTPWLCVCGKTNAEGSVCTRCRNARIL